MKKYDFSKTLVEMSRRDFLTGVGAGVLGAAGASALHPASAFGQTIEQLDASRSAPTRPDRFSRMFNLRPFAEPSSQVERALMDIGAKGGLMDAKDPLQEGPIRLITNPELSPNNRDNPALTAGVTFFGQFLDHDMTFDTTSRLAVPTPPEGSPNSRTPALDLDSVYGDGPTGSPQYYDPSDRAKFRIESGGQFEDLCRSADDAAIIPDPRNDENIMIAGFQVAMMLFHNRVVDKLRRDGDDRRLADADDIRVAGAEDFAQRRSVFAAARRLVTWHYQWIIVNEFLPQIIGPQVVNDILQRGRRYYTPRAGEQSMPVEFQGACYRFGHSLVRPSYRANLAGDLGQPFFGFIFDPAGEGQDDPVDMRGGARAARRFIGWQTFFNFGGDQAINVRPPKVIDTKISTPLFNLPLGAIASGEPPTSLPQRNLLRHLTWSLPSGQSIAQAMRISPLAPNQLSDLAQFGVGLERSTPLWYYILREAEVGGGARLTGVGARIVGEVFLGLLGLDPNSYFSERNWRPTLPSRTRGTFQMVDLLTFAGVDPASRKQ